MCGLVLELSPSLPCWGPFAPWHQPGSPISAHPALHLPLCPALASLPYTCPSARQIPAVVTDDVYCLVDVGRAHVSLITRVAALHNPEASNLPMTPESS